MDEDIKATITVAMTRAHPPVIMTMEDIAIVCGLSYNYVRNEVQHQKGFPPKLSGFKQPRWSRDAIFEWANLH